MPQASEGREGGPAGRFGVANTRSVPIGRCGRYGRGMSEMISSDRRASWREVAERRDELRARAEKAGLTHTRLGDDGTVVVHAPDPGYRSVGLFAADAADVVGTYVHVVTDDVPAAATDSPPL